MATSTLIPMGIGIPSTIPYFVLSGLTQKLGVSGQAGDNVPVVGGTQVTARFSIATADVVKLPDSVAAGDLLIVFHFAEGNSTVATAPTGWTELVDARGDSNLISIHIIYKIAAGGETTVQIDKSPTERFCAVAYRITAATWHGSQAPEASADTVGFNANPNPATKTTSWPAGEENLWIAVMSVDDNAIGATGTGATVSFTASGGIITSVTTTPPAGGTGYRPNSQITLLVLPVGTTLGTVLATTDAAGVITEYAATPVSGGAGYTTTTGAATSNAANVTFPVDFEDHRRIAGLSGVTNTPSNAIGAVGTLKRSLSAVATKDPEPFMTAGVDNWWAGTVVVRPKPESAESIAMRGHMSGRGNFASVP